MISLKLTTLNWEAPSIQRKEKTRNFLSMKIFQNFTTISFVFPIFNSISRFRSKISPQTTALQYFKKKVMAEMNSQFTIDEDQERETQPIYLFSDESDIVSPCLSPTRQLPNNVPDTYSGITQPIAAQHEQMSSSGNFAPQCLPTPPTSFISDDDNDEAFTPIMSNPAQLVPCTPNHRPHPLQLSQQRTPIPDTPESPTPENRGQSDIFRPFDLPENPSTALSHDNPP